MDWTISKCEVGSYVYLVWVKVNMRLIQVNDVGGFLYNGSVGRLQVNV